MSRPCHKLAGAMLFPSPGLSFPVSAVSKSALKLVVLMEVSPFLNPIDTFICVSGTSPQTWLRCDFVGRGLGEWEGRYLWGPMKEE